VQAACVVKLKLREAYANDANPHVMLRQKFKKQLFSTWAGIGMTSPCRVGIGWLVETGSQCGVHVQGTGQRSKPQ
jgi:hypothetical protein